MIDVGSKVKIKRGSHTPTSLFDGRNLLGFIGVVQCRLGLWGWNVSVTIPLHNNEPTRGATFTFYNDELEDISPSDDYYTFAVEESLRAAPRPEYSKCRRCPTFTSKQTVMKCGHTDYMCCACRDKSAQRTHRCTPCQKKAYSYE